jgi:polyisoprenoid-binding protein YceI
MNTNTEIGSEGPSLASSPALVSSTTWDVDTSHASAGFKVRHLMLSHVRGQLGPVTGWVVIDEEDLSRSAAPISSTSPTTPT